MEELEKKLRELKELLEKGMSNGGLGGPGSVIAGKVLPSRSIGAPKPAKPSNGQVKIPGTTPATKTSPVKSAEQTQNKDIKDLKMKEAQAALKAAPMVKEEGPGPTKEPHYHIHQGGMKVTSNPLSLSEINSVHGGIKKLEAAGYRAIEHKPEQLSIKKNGQWELEDIEKSGYKGYTDEDNARRKSNNTGETTGIHTMNSIKQYGGSGVNAAGREAAEMKRRSKKNPVKIYTPEEIAEINAKKD